MNEKDGEVGQNELGKDEVVQGQEPVGEKRKLFAFFHGKRCLMFSLAMAFFCGYACYSVIAPFFSHEVSWIHEF